LNNVRSTPLVDDSDCEEEELEDEQGSEVLALLALIVQTYKY
jgi:hypothetical protein